MCDLANKHLPIPLDEAKRSRKKKSQQTSSHQPAEADEHDKDEVSQETSGFRDSGITTVLDKERLASVRRRRKVPIDGRDSKA